ncbi:MAG: dihydrolipoyl dehydrogenase [Alphaproteobacteria bacterium]
MTDTFDLVVIGGGPGGYVAAIRAAQLGMKVACVDKRRALGGTCLNIGCIPSKALLQSSERYQEANESLAQHGVKLGKVGLDLKTMMGRKDKVVEDLTKGVAFLFKKNGVHTFTGTARITAPGEVVVGSDNGGGGRLGAERILIATGSDHMPLPGVEIDEKRIVSSTGALSLKTVPGHLVVVGAGYIGLELGSVWRRLGARVTVIELLDGITPGMDGEVAKHLQRILAKQGLQFRLSSKVTGANKTKDGVVLAVEPAAGGAAETIACDIVLVAIGRRPYTEGLDLESLGVETDNRGFIKVDGRYETGVPGVYAIGDAVPGPMLAHKAADEAVAAVETMAGQSGHVNYDAIPAVIYTWPEVAAVGKTEEALEEAGLAYRVGRFPFTANSRARVNAFTDGFVKILADRASDRVLGVHIIGPEAGDIIHEALLAMEFGGAAEDIARTCHAHPSLNEAVREAALAVDGRAIHI